MRAVAFERNGGPEVLEFKEVPDPSPRAGQVLVDIETVGVNFRDVYEREGGGYGSAPPAIIGVEGSGRTADGRRVAWVDVPNSYAERVAANPDKLVPIPDQVPTEIAPGLVQTEFSVVRFHGDRKAAKAVYEGLKPLSAEDIADCVVFAVTRPPHVDIDEIVVRPVAQANVTTVARKAPKAKS